MQESQINIKTVVKNKSLYKIVSTQVLYIVCANKYSYDFIKCEIYVYRIIDLIVHQKLVLSFWTHIFFMIEELKKKNA